MELRGSNNSLIKSHIIEKVKSILIFSTKENYLNEINNNLNLDFYEIFTGLETKTIYSKSTDIILDISFDEKGVPFVILNDNYINKKGELGYYSLFGKDSQNILLSNEDVYLIANSGKFK